MLEIIKRDDVIITATITDPDDNPVNITDGTVFFTVKVKKTDSDDDAVIAKEVTVHTNPTQGETAISLTNVDTDLQTRTYFYDLQLVDGDGKVRSVSYGQLRINPDITQRTE